MTCHIEEYYTNFGTRFKIINDCTGESMGSGYDTLIKARDVMNANDNCTPPCINPCTPNWNCEYPLNGYESDGCGNRRLNSNCNSSNPTSDNTLIYMGLASAGLVVLYLTLKKK